MKKLPIVLIILTFTALVLAAGCTGQESVIQKTEMESMAEKVAASIDSGLEELKAGVGENALALAETGLSGPEAEAVLAKNLLKHPWAISSLVIAKNGTVVTAVPENFADIVGTDLSWQPQVQKANTEQVPIVSDVFMMAEGFAGISQSYPVFSPTGEYLGYTDITYTPDAFIGRQIRPLTNGTDYDVWVTQTDGTVIYDTTKEEIGKNLFTDPAYDDPALQKIFERIIAEPEGSGQYTFWDQNWDRNITKTAVWDTAGIDGAEWRVVVTRPEGQPGEGAGTENGGASPTAAAPTQPTDARYTELKQFVDNAAGYAREHGKETAIKEFNDPDGAFTDGEQYIFAYGMHGTVLALPYQPGLIGTVRTGITDSNGVEFIDRAIEVAGKGGGSLYYIYPNPADGYREEFKLSYVVPVADEWFVGSGIYLPEIPANFNDTERDELVERVKNARDYSQKEGKAKAVADFNDPDGVFADGSRYIFAYDYNGTTLALPFQPEYIGTNRLDFADTYGVEILRWEISAAKRGGGFVYVQYLNPDTGDAGMKLCYVAPVDD
ncbi:MAG TPA: cache domain-containing protein, partial [Methanoregulaceae archaeon]|nr:cache domain-containing protein [Methanoregulaceae archaeon]